MSKSESLSGDACNQLLFPKGAAVDMETLKRAASAARLAVKQIHPHATSCYTGARSASVYDGKTDAELGASDGEDARTAVELAWVDAMRRLVAHLPAPVVGAPSPPIPHR